MSTSPTIDQEARVQRHVEFLDILIAQGMDLATRLHQQSITPSDLCSALAEPGVAVPFITPEVIAAFAQINQTVRRAILVSRKLSEPIPLARPARMTRDAENPVHRGTEAPRTEFAEHLYSPDLEDRIGARPIPEIIAALARELGIPPDTTIAGLLQPTTCSTNHRPDQPEPHPKPAQSQGSRTGVPPAAPEPPPGPPHPT